MATITFIKQNAPIDEYGRALYAVARSILRALLDSLSPDDLTDLNSPIKNVTMRQLAKVVRLDRDKGMRGDGFEWAVHEAIIGGEPLVTELVHHGMRRASKSITGATPESLLFGYERAKYLGFLDATIKAAGSSPFLLPDGSGRPYKFDTWVAKAALGQAAEAALTDRIKKIWKTDLFLTGSGDERYLAATVKSNYALLEGGRGLKIGIVPESNVTGHKPGVSFDQKHGLWLVTLADPNGFTGLYNDAYLAVGRAMCTLGKQDPPPYYTKPSAKGERVQLQLEKYPTATVLDIEGALNEAAQQDLIGVSTKLVGVNAPDWLHIKAKSPKVIAPKPSFERL
ncbi:hypothetical protein [Burkholderia cepacia]|uniref:hypothetical protein n=1 Tax=Burkholderia cepacia TaxID=292 RepID=UPI001590978E|nr:hypothetical protein [Burkholderia cepacia]